MADAQANVPSVGHKTLRDKQTSLVSVTALIPFHPERANDPFRQE